MTPEEKTVEIQACKDLEKDMLAFFDAEIAKVPIAYLPLAQAFWTPAKLAISAFLDAKIAAL
jgi:hypothetical protein